MVWKKSSYDVSFPMDEKAIKLKEHIQTLTGNCDKNLHMVNMHDNKVDVCGLRKLSTSLYVPSTN